MQPEQVYWDEVNVGADIPRLVKRPTHIQMLMWGGAVDDYNPMHADPAIATRAGYPEPIVFGPLIWSFLVQMVTTWMGVEGWLRKVTVRHNAPALAGRDIVCSGRVTAKYEREGEHFVELELQADYEGVERGTTGSAVVALPLRSQARPQPTAEPIPSVGWLRAR